MKFVVRRLVIGSLIATACYYWGAGTQQVFHPALPLKFWKLTRINPEVADALNGASADRLQQQLQHTTPLQALPLMESRFNKKYPTDDAHSLNVQREITTRLSLLRWLDSAKSHRLSRDQQLRFVRFYERVLQNSSESWLVQRQTLKNMSPLWHHLPPKDRDQLSAQIDLRAKAHWQTPDVIFASQIVGPHEK